MLRLFFAFTLALLLPGIVAAQDESPTPTAPSSPTPTAPSSPTPTILSSPTPTILSSPTPTAAPSATALPIPSVTLRLADIPNDIQLAAADQVSAWGLASDTGPALGMLAIGVIFFFVLGIVRAIAGGNHDSSS